MKTTGLPIRRAALIAVACAVWLALATLLAYGVLAADRAPVLMAPGQLLPSPDVVSTAAPEQQATI